MSEKTISEKIDELTLKMERAILSVEDAKNKTYPVVSDRYISEGLEAAYDSIVADNPELADVSAVGFTAILRQNDNLWTNGNRMFVNGEEIEGNLLGYAAEGQYEVVNAWYFAKHYEDDDTYHLSLQADSEHPFKFEISELDIRQKTGTITLSKEYYYNTVTISSDGWFNFEFDDGLLQGKSIEQSMALGFFDWKTKNMKLTGFGSNAFNCPTPYTLERIYCDAILFESKDGRNYTGETLDKNLPDTRFSTSISVPEGIIRRINLIEANFPELLDSGKMGLAHSSAYGTFIQGCDNPKLKIYIPKLKKLNSSGNKPTPYGSPLMIGVHTVELPESLLVLGSQSFMFNKCLRLNCKNATIGNEWYASTWNITLGVPRNDGVEQGLYLCDDWGATINLAVAANQQTEEWFIDLMTNKLRDMTLTSETRALTIPAAMLTTMQASEDGQAALGAAQAKGWTVGGD